MNRTSDQELAEQYRRTDEAQRAKSAELQKQRRAARTAALQARPSESRAKVKSRAERYWNVAREIWHGLDTGHAFHWKASERHLVEIAADMGLTLVTLSKAETAGYTLKRGQKPVGSLYFGAPISRTADLYVLECQFTKQKSQ